MAFRSPEAAPTVLNTAPEKLHGGSERGASHCTYQTDAGPSLVLRPISPARCLCSLLSRPGQGTSPGLWDNLSTLCQQTWVRLLSFSVAARVPPWQRGHSARLASERQSRGSRPCGNRGPLPAPRPPPVRRLPGGAVRFPERFPRGASSAGALSSRIVSVAIPRVKFGRSVCVLACDRYEVLKAAGGRSRRGRQRGWG